MSEPATEGAIEVRVMDWETGEVLESVVIEDDCALVTHGECYLDDVEQKNDGSIVLTIRGRQ